MTTILKHRRGTTAQHASFTGAVGEITVDTDKDTAVVHDGTTVGGFPLLAKTMNDGTANGVAYLDGSKVLTTGSALTFDGTNLLVGTTSNTAVGNRNFVLNDATSVGVSYNIAGTSTAVSYVDATQYITGTQTNIPYIFRVNASEQMRLTSTGLGIGTSSPDSKLVVQGGSGTYAQIKDGTVNTFIQARSADSAGVIGTLTNHALQFWTNSALKATLDSSGNLLVGTTSTDPRNFTSGSGYKLGDSFEFANSNTINVINRTSSGSGTFVGFRVQANGTGSITTDGTSTAYNTSSDYRLKENIAPMTGALAKVAALKPVTYTWKADGSAGEGFIAHELAEVCPAAVTGEKDAVDADGKPQYQGIDVSFLVGTLTAALQELKAEFDAYKASHP